MKIFLLIIFVSLFIASWEEISLDIIPGIYGQSENSTMPTLKISPLYSTNNGYITDVRVLDITYPIETEVSFFERGILNETIEVTNQGTYIETYLPNNIIRGTGNGIITTQNGEFATWRAYDSGYLNSNASQLYHGIIFFDSNPLGKLSFLESKVGIYTIQIGEHPGSYSRHIWEWK